MNIEPSGLTVSVHSLDLPQYQALLRQADLIFAVDVMNRERRLLYGRKLLESIAASDEPRDVASIDIEVDFDTPELEQLVNEVAKIRGSHDYQGPVADTGS